MRRRGWDPEAVLWWVAASLSCFAVFYSRGAEQITVIPATYPAVSAVEQPSLWEVPVAAWIPQGVQSVSIEAGALIYGALLVFVLLPRHFRIGFPLLSALVFAAALLLLSETHLLPAFWLLIIARCITADNRSGLWRTVGTLVCLVGAVLTTVDFGWLVVMAAAAGMQAALASSGRRRRVLLSAAVVVGLIGLVLTGLRFPSFHAALNRPWTALGLAFEANPWQPLHPIWLSRYKATALLLTVSLVLISHCLYSRGSDRLQPTGSLWTRLLFPTVALLFGICCVYYLPLALWIVLHHVPVVVSSGMERSQSRSWGTRYSGAAVIVAALILLLLPEDGPASLLTPRQRRVSLADFPRDLRILRISPSDRRVLEGALALPQPRPELTDRWDGRTSPSVVRETAALKDLAYGRKERYLRADGSWGGWREEFGRPEPDLIIVPTDELQAVRQLSLNPHWNLVTLDGSHVVFAAAAQSALRSRADAAIRLLYFLEWPAAGASVSPEGILEPGTEEDSRRISRALLAMRFPYAALRLLPEGDAPELRFLRAWSHVELAERSVTQTGTLSLWDQVHGLELLDSLIEDGLGDRQDRTFMRYLRDQLRSFVRDSADHASEAAAADDDGLLRQPAGGSTSVADHSGADVIPSDSVFVEVFESEDRIQRLKAVVRDGSLPPADRHEAAFYLACQALERGAAAEAADWLQEAQKTAPRGAFWPLVQLYVGQLER